jgi:hypothetical protein
LLCPACSQPVEESWESCASCGEPLTVASRVVVDRAGRPIPRWLDVSRRRAQGLKLSGEAASQDRLGSLRRIDEVRESEQSRAASHRARDDRQLLTVAGLAAALFILVVVALAIASLV